MITAEHLTGLPGLRREARDALVARQPRTVLEALGIPDVGRKATSYMLAAGLLTDPERVQTRTLAAASQHLQILRAARLVEAEKKGFKAHRMEQGVADWRARGWRVETSTVEARS